jgi:acetyl-CoA C-acetyltransferase/acetyl-CoA acyltransferase
MITQVSGQQKLVVVDGVRTAFCKMGTSFAEVTADELGRAAVQSLIKKTGIDPGTIDEVIFGCVGQPADAANVARVIALRAGIPKHVPAITVHRNCASGCEAITQAYEKMAAGAGSIFIVGGTENMSRYPLLFAHRTAKKFGQLARARTTSQRIGAMAAFRPSDFKPLISLRLGLSDPVSDMNMGETAELVGREASLTREDADQFSMVSHHRAAAAGEKLAEEITPVFVPPKYKDAVTEDVGPRPQQSMEALGKLKPVFDRKNGVVTAGNASQITDGAAALLVMTESKADELGLEPLGILTGYSYAGCDPARMGLGPVHAIAKAEERTGLGLNNADLIEINEAFAVQVLACIAAAKSPEFGRDELGRSNALGEISLDRLNVNGGAIALGHPVGTTGARLCLTILKELQRRNAKRGLVSLCVGGGQGAALWFERP